MMSWFHMISLRIMGLFLLLLFALASGCSDGDDDGRGIVDASVACTAEPDIMKTSSGVEFVRTPDACFEGLPGWPYVPHYVEIDGLRPRELRRPVRLLSQLQRGVRAVCALRGLGLHS